MLDKVKEFMGLGILAVGSSVFFYLFLKSLLKEMANKSWSSTYGQITSLEITKKGGHGDYRYGPELKYQFSVDGKGYESDSSSSSIGYPTRGLAEKVVAKYSINERVCVYYNPSNPMDNALQLGIIRSTIWGLIVSGLIMIITVIIIAKELF